MTTKPTKRQEAGLKSLQHRYGRKQDKSIHEDENLIDKLIQNHHAQQLLAEWQTILRNEQRSLMHQLSKK